MIRYHQLFLLMVFPLLLSGCTFSKTQNQSSVDSFPKERVESLAKALTTAGVKIYGSQFCSACKAQKDMFSDAWQFATYVECSTSTTNPAQNAACRADNIKMYPTWEFNDGSKLEGLQSLSELAHKISFIY